MVGVLGGYGAVGRVVARRLHVSANVALRIGGRNPAAARQLIETQLDGRGDSTATDIADAESLDRFCSGCDVIANCSGPSYRVLDRVARAAARAGACYVDAGGDDPVRELLADFPGTAVLSAGMAPGVTGLLPRWLAGQGFDECRELTAYVAARDRFTLAAAGDYLLSLANGYGRPLAAWTDGRPVPRALEPLTDITLPFFSGRQTAYPYLTTETERMADALGLCSVRWYNVFDGDGRVLSVAPRLQSALREREIALDRAAAELVKAADLDLFGHRPRQQFVMRLDGTSGGEPYTRTAVLRASGTYLLSGTICALATRALLKGGIPPGVHFAADVLDPGSAIAEIRHGPGVEALEAFAGGAGNDDTEEGAL